MTYYSGKFYSEAADDAGVADPIFDDETLGVHFYTPPPPFGVKAEWFDGETEGHDLSGYYVQGAFQPDDVSSVFARYEEYDGWRKGKYYDYCGNRTSIGYAYYIDEKTRVTAEYDIREADGAASQFPDDDRFVVQMMSKF